MGDSRRFRRPKETCARKTQCELVHIPAHFLPEISAENPDGERDSVCAGPPGKAESGRRVI
jgi:hypothetical protein